jgi:hypothetical protein
VGTKLNWSAPTSWGEVCARASARRKFNSLRRLRRAERRQQVLELIIELGGLQWGAQTRIAELLGVDRSVISKDLKALFPLAQSCEACGQWRPRLWLDDE